MTPRSKSTELFAPAYHALSREMRPSSAVFSLISTIVGGGVLSLPWAFAQVGLVMGAALLVLSALVSDFTIYLLVVSARRSGSESFEQLAFHAFGPPGRFFTILLIVLLTWASCVAYLILLSDLLTPLLACALGAHSSSHRLRAGVMVCSAVLVSPMCLLRTMHGLRYTSILSVCSVLLLAGCVGARSIGDRDPVHDILLWPDTWAEAAAGGARALPIFCISFLCHFK